MQLIGCASSFTSGAPWTALPGSHFKKLPCSSHFKKLSSQGCRALLGDDEGSKLDYDDVAAQWLSADFLKLRMRSSGLICNEAIQALRNHFQKKEEQPTTATMPSTKDREISESSPTSQMRFDSTSAYLEDLTQSLPNVVVLDETFFSQVYTSGSSYTPMTTSSFLDESFC